MKKLTVNQLNDMVAQGYIDEEKKQEMIENGDVSAGRQSKNEAYVILNAEGEQVVPQMYYKGNKGGVKNETDEMKKMRVEFQELVEKYCEKVKLEKDDDEDDNDNDDDDNDDESSDEPNPDDFTN